MKKAYALLAVLCIAILAACSNPLRPGRGGEGTITIGFGAASRIAVCREDLADLTHEITLTGPGGTITRSITGHGNVSISVAPGTWNIAIRAVGDTPPGYNNGITLVEHQFPSRMLRAIGFYRAEIRAGETTPVTVGMTSAVEVSNAAQLYNAMLLARTDGADRHDDGEKVIMLAGDITGVNMQMTVAAGQNITLASNYNVAIRRTAGFIGEIFYESTGGVLRLYRSGMAGSVYVEGRPGTAANPIQVAQVAGSRLDDQLDWLRQYAASRLYYLVEISDDWELPSTSTFVPSGVTEVNITIRGIGGGASIHFGGPGSLFSVGLGLTLVLDGDLTLEGGYNGSSLVVVRSGGNLVMNQGARLVGNTATGVSYPGGAVTVLTGGSFTMYGGEISGNYANRGGGVNVSGGVFTMRGGEISGNTRIATISVAHGGGVYMSNGTFILDGGTISYHTYFNIDGSGGGVFMSGGTFTMHSGNITGNIASLFGGGVNVNGGSFTMRGGYISGNTADNGAGGVSVLGGEFAMYGGTITGNEAHFGAGVNVEARDWDVLAEFTMHGGTISDNTAFGGGGGVRLGVGTFCMYGGTITRNSAANDGGGVGVIDTGIFTMHGGDISVNTANRGGGVQVSAGDGIFDMIGGTIRNNEAFGTAPDQGGGGVHTSYSQRFRMTGGIITGNSAHDGGGVNSRGNLIEIGGTAVISDNTAIGNGGGVAMGTNVFTMSGTAIISGNRAGGNGGGVFREAGGPSTNFNKNGGTIYGANAPANLQNFAGANQGHALHWGTYIFNENMLTTIQY